jgi:YggT family protein
MSNVTTGQFIAQFIIVASNILFLSILLRACLSWFAVDTRASGPGRLLDDITEPVLAPFRRVIPPIGSIDISPLAAMLVIQFAANIIAAQLR